MATERVARRRRPAGDDVRRRHAGRYFAYHWDDDGSLVGSFRLPPDQAAVFLHGIDAARGRIAPLPGEGDDASAEAAAGTVGSRLAADALVVMAEQILTDASAEASAAAAERFQLVIHTSAEALAAADNSTDGGPGATLEDGSRLHPATARRLTCNCPTSTLIEDADGNPLHLGRKHRRIRGRLLRAVHARDRGRCRAPGCTEPASQIHHIRHWANGGPTCLPNLISLCDAHHWAVHEGGFTIVTRRPGHWALLSPTGVTIDPVPATPAEPAPPLPHDDSLRDDAVSGHWDGTRLDIDYSVQCLTQHASAEASEPDTNGGWFDNILAMEQRAATSGDIIYVDEPDEPYTW